jgi:hypothetical protein
MKPVIVSKLPPLRLGGRAHPPFPDPATVLTANGRTAIVLGLGALAMPAGATVLMPEWHCGSEIDAVISAGGEPVLYRLDRNLNADLDDLTQKVRKLRPWAIYCTHYFGYPQPLAALSALATETGAVLIEDLALGLLSRGGTPAIGTTGDMTVFSLVKTLPLPDGGALWLRDKNVAAALKRQGIRANLRGARLMARRIGQKRGTLVDRFARADQSALDRWDPGAGFPKGAALKGASGLSNVLMSRMPFDDIRAAHRRNYSKLWQGLTAAVPSASARPLLPALPDESCPAYFPAWVADQAAATSALAAAGIESVRFWRRFHPRFGPDADDRLADLKRHVLRLPIHPGVDDAAIERMVTALGDVATT